MELLLNLGKRLVTNKANKAICEVKEMFDLDVYFAKILKAKYDALLKIEEFLRRINALSNKI